MKLAEAVTEHSSPDVDARTVLTTALTDPLAIVEWRGQALDLALRLARRARLLGRLAARLEDSGALSELPARAADQLRAALVSAAARERLARWEMIRVAEVLRDTDVGPLIALKGGAYLLLGLPNTAGRLFADVDFLADESDLPRVEQRLLANGWQSQPITAYDERYYRRWTHEIPPLMHREREVEVDVHHNILPRVARYKPLARHLIDASLPVDGTPYRVLSPPDMSLHAIVHLAVDSDFADKLRDLVDIDVLLAHFAAADSGFWDSLLERAALHGLGRPLYYCLRYCRLVFGSDIPESVQSRVDQWAPQAAVLRLMDTLVPAALFPAHPDRPSRPDGWRRQLLFIRSHWLRMPPWLLAYHTAHKLVVTRFGRDSASPRKA